MVLNIKHNFKKYVESDQKFITKFIEDLYINDITSGCSSVDKGMEFYQKSRTIMLAGGFNLQKCITNDPVLQKYFNKNEDIENNFKETRDDTSFTESQFSWSNINFKRVLGVEWDTGSASFIFQFDCLIKLAKSLKPTKRNILNVSASFYDPLSCIAPVTVRVKVIFQLLCKDKIDWNDCVTDELKSVWNDFISFLQNLNCIKIQRFVFVSITEEIKSLQLHSFCDRSTEVYCAVIYIRVEASSGVKLSFLTSKTKVAPMKPSSVPRLELLRCFLLGQLIKEVVLAVSSRVCVDGIFCWTDSEAALCWVKGKEKCWKPWVENRVVAIRQIVNRDRWGHIRGPVNPADIPTRVCDVKDFIVGFGVQLFYCKLSLSLKDLM